MGWKKFLDFLGDVLRCDILWIYFWVTRKRPRSFLVLFLLSHNSVTLMLNQLQRPNVKLFWRFGAFLLLGHQQSFLWTFRRCLALLRVNLLNLGLVKKLSDFLSVSLCCGPRFLAVAVLGGLCVHRDQGQDQFLSHHWRFAVYPVLQLRQSLIKSERQVLSCRYPTTFSNLPFGSCCLGRWQRWR